MAISLILSTLFVIMLLIGAGLMAWRLYQTKFKKLSFSGTIVILVAIICLSLIPGSFHTVEAGQVAVVKHLGEARTVRTAGTYLISGSLRSMSTTMLRFRIWISELRRTLRMLRL